MNTRMITVNPLNPEAGPIDEAVNVLKRGGVIGYPTETVYGLAVDAYNEDALRKLFMVKEREMNKPISLLVRDVAMVEAVASRIPPVALSLIRGYWPGALTIIFAASERCSPILTGQSGKIGVRISPHRIVQTLLDAFKNPITATSANLSGMPSVVDSHEVYRVFRGKIDLVIDGGKAPGEGESTVIDVTVSPPKVLRKGVVKVGGMDSGGV